MVYKNIINEASFASVADEYSGQDTATVDMETDDFTFVKTANPETWSGEGDLTYTITLTSVSGEELLDVTVSDVLPADVVLDITSVTIDGAASTNFDYSNPPNILFGSDTLLSVTAIKPLVITFNVTSP